MGVTPVRRAPLPRNVKLLGGVSFLTDVSSELLYPIVPLFLTATLGAPMAAIGLIEGIAEGTASFLKLVSGRIADRMPRRRPLVLAGYTISAVAKPLLALAGSWPVVLATRVLDRTGKGLRGPARDALIAESTSSDQRGRAFGLHRAMDTAGAVVGPLAALVALGVFGLSYREIFWLAAIPAAAGVLLLTRLREPERTVRRAPGGIPSRAPDPNLRRLLVVIAIFSLGNSSNTFLLLRARDLGWSDTGVIALYAVFNAVYAAAAGPLGSLSDRVGRRRLVQGGFAVAAVVYAAFAWITEPWAAAFLLAVYGLYVAATAGAGRAWVADLAPADGLATAMGWYQMVTGIGLLAASLLAGGLWSAFGASTAFAVSSTLSVTASLALFLRPPETVAKS